ncbi:hypothetical protein BY457_12223 [Marinilabilia salmonicolor]|jgi:hypothetical protein|nr:hypothetical protein BY457_12223 [Marinilabilia salmonicolor]
MDFRDGMLKFREIQGISGELEEGNGFLSDRRPFLCPRLIESGGELFQFLRGVA